MKCANSKLFCVAPDMVERIWPFVRHFLLAALRRGDGDDTEETLRNGGMLWIVHDGKHYQGAAITKLFKIPAKGLICQIMACGGTIDICKEYLKDLEQFARNEKCRSIRISGRPGWKKMLKDYQEPFITLEKQL